MAAPMPGRFEILAVYNAEVAHKYKMSSMQAALGLAQLERIDELIAQTYKGDHEKLKLAVNNVAIVLQRLQKELGSISTTSARFRLAELVGGIDKLRQFHIFLLLLFGMCFANETFALIRGIENSSMSLSGARIDVFEPVAALAFFVFTVLVILHIVQWIVATRLQPVLKANFNHAHLENSQAN
jgi:hypothetical protein